MAANAFNDKDKNEFFKLINENRIKIKSGYCLRLHPAVKKLKKIINNDLKNILKININTNSFLPSWRKKNYTKSAKKSMVGVLNELSHEIDLILHLFGKPKSLYASYLNTKSLEINTEDVADIIFNMNNKLNLNLHLDFVHLLKKERLKQFLEINKNCVRSNKELLIFLKFKNTTINKFKLKKYFYINSQIKEMFKISKSKNKTYWMSELKDAIYVLDIIKKIKSQILKN